MTPQKDLSDFRQTAEAIAWMIQGYPKLLSWAEIADQMHQEKTNLQRIFKLQTGVDPERFLQSFYTRRFPEKSFVASANPSINQSFSLSSPNDSIRPNLEIEIRNFSHNKPSKKNPLPILRYSFAETLFGPVLCASCHEGLCFLGFADHPRQALNELETRFPETSLQAQIDDFQRQALNVLTFQEQFLPKDHPSRLVFCLKGSEFQRQVWKALCHIPAGQTLSYGELARRIGHPTACRAVGSAVGQNPISWLIPCHRVVRSGGAIGGYHWGPNRKAALLSWETLRYSSNTFSSLSYENHYV